MDAYERIAQQLLLSVNDAGEWSPCWHRNGLRLPQNASSGRRYEGINILSCWVAQEINSFGSNLWATYMQWQELGAQVARGSKGTPIVFWSRREPKEGEEKGAWYARSYTVFNRDQVIDAPAEPEHVVLSESERIDTIELFFKPVREVAAIEEKDQDRAFYDRANDRITLPVFGRFTDAAGYYSILLHELTHWTGHPDREARTYGERFGDDAYALEELTAELGAVFLAADLGLEPEPRPDHAQYIAHWFRILKERPDAFTAAVGQARKAAVRINHLAKGDSHDAGPTSDGDVALVES